MKSDFAIFLEYCQTLFGRDWESIDDLLHFHRPAPATPEQLAAVRSLWPGYKLPIAYVDYLEQMGRSSGRLRLFFDAPDNVADLLAYVERSRVNEQGFAPARCVVLTAPGLSGGRGLLYDTPESEPRLVTLQWDEVGRVESSSFVNFLFQQVWTRRWFLEGHPLTTRLPSAVGQEQVLQWLRQRSFVRANLPLAAAAHDPIWNGYEHEATRILMDQSDETLFVHIVSENPDALLDMVQSFQRAFCLSELNR